MATPAIPILRPQHRDATSCYADWPSVCHTAPRRWAVGHGGETGRGLLQSSPPLRLQSAWHQAVLAAQRSRLLSMVDTLVSLLDDVIPQSPWRSCSLSSSPTVQQTSSGQSWLDSSASRTARTKAVIGNPALSDWFFYHRVIEFLKAFHTGVLGATDYWLRFEWQHRGSPEAALTCTAWPGLLTHHMWSSSSMVTVG